MAEKKASKTAKTGEKSEAAGVSMSMKKDELIKAAEDMGLKISSKATKADIIEAIKAADESKPEPAKKEAEAKEPEAKKESPKKEAKEKPASDEAKKTGPSKKKDEAKKEIKDEEAPKDEAKDAGDSKAEAAASKEMKASTERKRKEKAERREAKAARKEANKIEEKRTRPNNILLAVLICGVLIAMFAFVGGYNYFSKPATVEAYLQESGMAEMYNSMAYDEHSSLKMKAEGNTLKIVVKVNDDATEEDIESYTSEDGEKNLKYTAASLLTAFKPETRAFGGEVRLAVKKGDETICYHKMTYSEAKKFLKELEKEAEEEAEEHDHEHEHDHDHEGEEVTVDGEDVTVESEDGTEIEVVTDEAAE